MPRSPLAVRLAPLVAAVAALLAAGLLAATPAAGQATQAAGVDAVADALRSDPVYVDPEAELAIPGGEADDLRERIRREGAGPMYIAIVPGALAAEAGGDPTELTREIAGRVGRRGTYVVIAGRSLRAGSTGAGLDPGVAPDLATEALERRGEEGPTATLQELIALVGDARRQGGGNPTGDGGSDGEGLGVLGGVLLLAAGGGGIIAWRGARRRRREREEQVAELRETAHDDLVALGDDVRALDLDVQMPSVDEEAKQHYAAALERYERAERLLDAARDPADFEPIGQALEEGRYEMAAAKARLEGRPVPERRPPCFFDPRHGPSTRDVMWAPDGYDPRPVPACEADAVRIESGDAPLTREVVAHGRRVPLYDAPGYYGPYAGGFFGGAGGLLPGLLFGSLLGGALAPDRAFAEDVGGGGDVGGGDFGGGDFGGGDFGGGGDF